MGRVKGSKKGWRTEAGDRWAQGWAAGACPLWRDTPRWRRGGAEPCPGKRPHVSHSQGQGDLSNLTCAEMLLRVKREVVTPHSKWCQPTHRPLHQNTSWLRDVCGHRGGPRDKANMDSEPGKARKLATRSLEEMPHISDSNYHRDVALSEPARVCVFTHSSHTLFSPNKHLTCLTLFCLWGNSFLQRLRARGLVTGHWSLVV